MIKINKTEASMLADALLTRLDASVKYMADAPYKQRTYDLEAAARCARRIDELRRRARRGAK